ncbi:MAG: hypothetical protein KC535_01975 [Nanoarchaeota archaeon]|nr:hypothetical protein [Nanoarchaeota archaeon]
MGLFGKSKIEDLPSFDDQNAAQVASETSVSKEVELVTSVKDEFSITISGILRQSQKKLQETNESLGRVESRLHNVKIYQESLKKMAETLEAKLLHMRGGSQETIEEDLAEEEQNVILYLKGISSHLSGVILELRDLRRLLSKVSVIPTDPQVPPLETGREFGAKVVEMVHKIEGDLKQMSENLTSLYSLEADVAAVAKEHGVTFPQDQQQAPQGQPEQQQQPQ